MDKYAYADELGFIVIKPDSFITGVAKSILDYFQGAGFEMRAYSFIENITQSDLEKMHSNFTFHNSTRNFYWWMISEQSRYAPYLGIVVSNSSSENCLKQLNRLKGDTDPLFYNHIGIRQTMRGINKCMNCVHVPDDIDKMLVNLRAFFSDEQINDIMNGSTFGNIHYWHAHFEYLTKWYDGKVAHRFMDIILKSKIDILSSLYKIRNRKIDEYAQICFNRLSGEEYMMETFLLENDMDLRVISSIADGFYTDDSLTYDEKLQLQNACRAIEILSNTHRYTHLSESDVLLLQLCGVKLYPLDWLILKGSMLQWPLS